ncbi:hypothetical protein E3P92_02398 [Wallemia ichthyophaga]|uniref:Uncharacterized protein n=1 Tax=Wallemia ichthyophaga TaxID=245174 RepID=A0A4T0FQ50_WALIC|nr:hypothetical protein E3P91_02410 [Wallemia ichthyophaga]TIA90589.1 hypothetical protein E3P97_02411 [Wallemia ichthyophaga]TIB06850.1 hypothetical protein E3P96_00001 [Wallemia ichthyophaga]TIB11538.1 hypothetical protein E3P90_02355 [Wallemia ichthyophaga]TIB12902.1 hypothetical protein E3P93_02115 [Wallemia ichthyophaga]
MNEISRSPTPANKNGLSGSFSSYVSTNATTIGNSSGYNINSIGIDVFEDTDSDEEFDSAHLSAASDAISDVNPNTISIPAPTVTQQINPKLMHVINKLGIDVNEISSAQSYNDLNTIANQYIERNDFIINKCEIFLEELNIEIRFGEISGFSVEENVKLIEAFSNISFKGDSKLKKSYVHRWAVILSESRDDTLGTRHPKRDIHMGNKVKKPVKKIKNAFTRDVFIDCRFHKPVEIERIFLNAQGL